MKIKLYLSQVARKNVLLTAISMLILAACGGGGSGGGTGGGTGGAPGGTPVVATTIVGTAATGMPITGQVIAIDSTGRTFSATTNSLGAYTVNVASGVPPFVLTVTGTAGGKVVNLTSVATAAGQTVNITPLTDLIVSTAAGQPGGAALVNLCAPPTPQAGCISALNNAAKTANLNAAVTAITNMITSAASSVAGVASPNLLNGAFTANGTGMDALLDALLVAPASVQGAMATVTLIAVPGASGVLGTVTMPGIAGGSSVPAITAPPPASIASSVVAAKTLSDINVCFTSFSALYPSNMTVAPASSVVAPFVDASFSLAGPAVAANPAFIINKFSTLKSAGGLASPNPNFSAAGFAPYDFTPQISPAMPLTTTPPLSANTAWVNISGPHHAGELLIWKMVKGAAYAGCPSGWRIAGFQHLAISNSARINKISGVGVATIYNRELSFHVNTTNASAEGITSIVATDPSLSVYSGNPATPASGVMPLTLIMPPAPVPPAIAQTVMGFQGQVDVPGSFYGGAEAIQSCQDLAAANIAPAGTPCFDETVMTPSTTFTYTVTGTINYAFNQIVGAVPLSVAFAQANDVNLFAQNIVASPAGAAALNTAVAGIAVGAPMDNIISFTYTLSNVYGAYGDNCNIGVTDVNNTFIMRVEMNATGQQTGCTFVTSGLNNGSLAKPASLFGGTGSYASVADSVLGNQAVTGISY
ncbi:MAG: carboxypeptidase-like regulatory domain-containing protein [Gallionella sp.]